jgi:NAD(P)-dependent dehydrogenase (short-subunit alcohol dehydrogenase family)
MSTAMTIAPQLDGRVAIVTGGSRGIGLAIAAALLARGARVAVNGRSAEHLEAAEAHLTGPKGHGAALAKGVEANVLGIQGDVASEADVERLVNRTVETFGGLDILINNAGVGRFANVADLSTEAWRSTIDTNLTGVFFCTRAAIPHLKRRGGGWIINISSLAGRNSFAGGAAYCATKAGLNAFTESLMLEIRYDNIRVSTIMPGSVQTSFGGHEEAGADWKLAPDDVAEVVTDLLAHPARSLPSRVEMRPSKPKQR